MGIPLRDGRSQVVGQERNGELKPDWADVQLRRGSCCTPRRYRPDSAKFTNRPRASSCTSLTGTPRADNSA